MNVARSWPSNGQLAVSGARWIMACGDYDYHNRDTTYSCEMLDTHASIIRWTRLDNIPNSVCIKGMSTVGVHQRWFIIAGGYN